MRFSRSFPEWYAKALRDRIRAGLRIHEWIFKWHFVREGADVTFVPSSRNPWVVGALASNGGTTKVQSAKEVGWEGSRKRWRLLILFWFCKSKELVETRFRNCSIPHGGNPRRKLEAASTSSNTTSLPTEAGSLSKAFLLVIINMDIHWPSKVRAAVVS